MGKWLSLFLTEHQESGTDIPDTLSIVSGVSGSESKSSVQNSPSVETLLPPLVSGWIVTYLDQQGALVGGWDERASSTVTQCDWNGKAWVVRLSGGVTIPLMAVRGVGKTNAEGRLVAAWTVRAHGYDGTTKMSRDVLGPLR